MAYVPGYQHDVFISYAHADDRDWINRFVDRLRLALSQRLGIKPHIWIDDHQLRQSRDFSKEIPDSVAASAVFLLLPSPTYIRSRYCVDEECRLFVETLAAKRSRFTGERFANELFAIRCPILPIEGNEHWTLFSGLTDIAFCDESDTLLTGSPGFEIAFRKLVGELVGLLTRMRNHSKAVFLYPANPASDLQDVHKSLVAELSVRSYRILPDRTVNLQDQLREAALSVFLLGAEYDESAGDLVELAGHQSGKPWVVWRSPSAENLAAADQLGFCTYVEQLEAAGKTYLDADILPSKLKEEVLGLLQPDPRALAETEGKPRVYLLYNARDRAEVKNAGLISFYFRKDFYFEHPDDPAKHTLRLTRSDGVLLVWGSADEDWCAREFAEMVQSARRAGAHGLCLFDPRETKAAAVQEIRRGFTDLYVGEQFGKFDPIRLAAFFTAIQRRGPGARW